MISVHQTIAIPYCLCYHATKQFQLKLNCYGKVCMRMSMTAKELAKLLGVSQAAVSLAFNGKPGISEETRRRIMEAADAHQVRRAVHRQGPDAIIDVVCYKKHGMVFGETPFFSALMEGIFSAASAQHYTVRISYIYGGDISPLMAFGEPSVGIILIATEMMAKEDIEPIQSLGKPTVVLDALFRYRNYFSVTIDNQKGAYDATQCLLNHGHRFIGHLKSSVTIRNFVEREYGFLAACADVPDCTPITASVGSTQEAAYADMLAWLKTNPKLPTGFFADNDLIAISCIRALKDMHFRIPQDVSIVGFDDIPMSAVSSPALTTIHVYKEDMGSAAVDMLRQIIDQPDRVPFTLRISTELVERRSVLDLREQNA